MSVLITGAGLIGCHFAERAVRAGQTVVLYDVAPKSDYVSAIVGENRVALTTGDLRDIPAIVNVMIEHKVTTIVHTAGLIGGRVEENSYTGITGNILGTIHILEAARLLRIKRVVFVSSRAVYDRSRLGEGPVREETPIGGNGAYGATKACSEIMFKTYARLYDLDTIILRPSAVFGRGHYAGGSSVGIRMRDLAVNILRGRPFKIDAGAYSDNEYVYAKDVALAIDLACKAQEPQSRVYNVGGGAVISASDLCRAVHELFPAIGVALAGREKRETDRYPMDLSRARAELGYSPQYPFKAALKDYVEAMRASFKPESGTTA